MNKKDLILLTAYTPDLTRKNILLEALKSIDKNKFDIMISSHSLIPEEAYDYCDYFVYDKNNTLLFDSKYRLSFWFSCPNFRIFTTEYKDYNHLIAAGSLITNGLSSAKNFGYSKVHWFDYDTIFSDDSELTENSTLLNTHSIIWYRHPDLQAFSGMSFNLNKIHQDWFDTSNKSFYNFLDTSGANTLEMYNYSLINKQQDTFEKSLYHLQEKLNISRYSADESDWLIIVYDKESKEFIFFNYNKTGNTNNSYAIINNTKIESMFSNQKNTYVSKPLGEAKDIHDVKLILNDKIVKHYQFNILNKEEYIIKNKIEYTH